MCFNEAAALHRGKLRRDQTGNLRALASMRPRLFTAENLRHVADALRDKVASMRPRLFTAENRKNGRKKTESF